MAQVQVLGLRRSHPFDPTRLFHEFGIGNESCFYGRGRILLLLLLVMKDAEDVKLYRKTGGSVTSVSNNDTGPFCRDAD